jgi:hypothetical protein
MAVLLLKDVVLVEDEPCLRTIPEGPARHVERALVAVLKRFISNSLLCNRRLFEYWIEVHCDRTDTKAADLTIGRSDMIPSASNPTNSANRKSKGSRGKIPELRLTVNR